jgi:hypothetical protein
MQDSYIQSRSTAIESIETTIAELGQIFNQLAHMVAEQRETVQRIDADTFDIASNVGGAQRELLKYYTNISSNRWLMLKVFGVLIVFVRSFSFVVVLEDTLLTTMLVVLTFYLSFMTDFFQLWLRLTVVIYTRVYSRHGLMHIDLTRMHIPGVTIQLVVRSHLCPSFLSVCRASFLLLSSRNARRLGPHHRQSKYV